MAFLRIIVPISWFYWVGGTTLGYAIGGVAGVFSGGLMSGLPLIALQIVILQRLKKNVNIWVISSLATSLLLGIVFFWVIFLSVTASDYANPFSTQVFTLTGIIYGLGTAIAFGSLYRKPRVFLG
jgi:heme/copper-type cytochrome/quinol oxidase subunit 4